MNDLPPSHDQNDIVPSALVLTNNLTSATDKVAPQQVTRVPDIVSTEREDSFTFKSAKQSSSSSSLRGGRSAHSSGRIEVSENFVAMNLKKKKIRTLRGGKRSGKYHGGNNRGEFTSYPQRSKPLGLQVDDAQGIGSGRSKYSINKLMDEEDNTDVDNDDEDEDEEDDNNDSYEIAAENSSIDIASNKGMDGQKTRPEQPLLLPVSGLTMSQADMQAEVEAELRTAAIVAARSFVPLGATDSQAAARLGGFNNGRSSFSYVSAAASAAGGGMGNGGGAIDGGAGRTAKVDGGDVLEACLDALDTSRPPSASLKSSTKSLSGGARVTKVKSTIDDRSDRGRPLCSGHQLECAMRKVKKEGPNKGRWFYSCPADKDAQCGFFCWKDADSRAAVTQFLEAASEAALAEAAASAAALSSSSANSSGGLSVAAKFHLQVEHRVRCASLLRWNDKAYGVTSLRAEIVRREIGPKIPKSLLEQARAQDLKLAIDSVKGTKANAKSSNPKKKAKTAANVTDAPESKTRISTAVNVTKPFVATSSAVVSTTTTTFPLAAAIVDEFAFAEVAQTKVTKVAQEDENEVIYENVSNGSSGNSDDSSSDSSEDSSESDVDDADDKETGGDVTMKVDDEDEDLDEGFRRRKKVLGKRRAAPKKSQQRRKEVPSDTDEETAIDVDKDGASLDDRSKRQTKEPSVSVNSLRRHECVAVLVFDDVSVWREAESRRKAVAPQNVSSVDQNVSTVNQNEGDSMDMASVSHQTHMTHDSSDETPLRDPIGKILYTTLKKTFGYTSFRGEKQLVDLSTLEIIKPSLSEPILSESMPSSISPSSTIQPVEMTIQEWACRRVLAGKSTLIVAATGTGKSLCYQLPAMILGNSISSRSNNGNSVGEITTKGPYLPYGITVVISPLVSLMRDQMLRLPRGLTGICISGSGSQGAEDAASALIALRDRRAHVLFVSPERLFSRSFSRLARDPDVMPAVACVCVDEAHVMSEWSHNFRPSYLRLNSLIDDLLRPRSVLALTATATPSVTEQVALSLRINNGGTWISGWRRPNLRFSASWTGPLTPEELRKREREWRKEHPGASEAEFRAFPQKSTDIDRSKALLDLLKAVAMVGVPQDAAPAASSSTRADNEADEKIASASKDMTRQTSREDSVDDALLSGQPPSSIIYTSSQAEADAIATFLSGHGVSAAAYHAGMGLDQRHRVHSRFLSGSVRVVAATIAFGMGLDKPDVRLIVHYSLPRSIEEYVQQCGRAGRDGLPALCHALVDRTGEDARRLHSLTHGDELEWRQVAGLLLMLVTNGARAMRVARSSSALICDHVFKLYKRSTRQDELTELLLKCGVGGGDVEGTTTASLEDADEVSTSNGVEFTVSISSLAARLGLKSEVAETILCYLEALGSVDIIGPRHTHVDITIISGSGGALKIDPIIQAAMMLAQSHGAKPSTLSGSTSSFSPLSGLDPATRLLFPSSLFGVEAVDLKTSRGGGGGGRAGQSSFYLDNSYGRSQPREEPSRSQTASEPAWVAHDDRGRLVIRACLDDLAIFITAMQIESECAQAISAGQAKPSYFRRMTVSNLQRHLFNLQSSKVVQLQFRDWGIAVRIDAECSSLYNASAEAACLLVHPPEALQAFLSRALADEDMHKKDSRNDGPGGASDVPTVRAASGMGLPPLLFPLLLTLYNKVLKNTDLSLRRLDSSYALLQATAAGTWREAFSLLRKSGRSTRDGGQNSPEALLLDLVGRYLSGTDGTGALVLNNAHDSSQEAVIERSLRLPLIPLPASERRALSMDVLACVRKIKVLLGSDALTTSEDAWKDEPGNGGGGGGGGLLSVSTVITRVPLVARPEAWKWWSMTDALPPQIPSPIINASAVARILHGIPSALFPSRDFRLPGQYGRGG
jgi:superfamily II DNA/RNA helicase